VEGEVFAGLAALLFAFVGESSVVDLLVLFVQVVETFAVTDAVESW